MPCGPSIMTLLINVIIVSSSEPMSSMSTLPMAVSDPSFPSPSLGLPSATPSPSLGLPSAGASPSAPPMGRVDSAGPRSLPPHLGFSQNKDLPSVTGALTVSPAY